jgi:hypothetical protein
MALTIKDLGVVLSAVFEAHNGWYNICLALNVVVSTLDSTDVQFPNPGVKFLKILKIWLMSSTELTGQDIVGALCNR